MKKTIIAAALLCSIGSVQAATVSAPVSFGGHNYYLITPDSGNLISWTDAQTAAQGIPNANANLVTINDAAENDFVRLLAQPSANLWIGFNDATTEGNFSWVGGGSTGYTNWRSGEPNQFQGDDEDYVHMWTDGTWNDLPNAGAAGGAISPLYAVAESPVPVPAAIWLFGSALGILGLGRRRA